MPGLVLRYSYLWRAEQLRGREEGVKDRPCAVVMVVTQSDGKEMGHLDFKDIEINMLGPDSAYARGHWQLTMSDGKQPGGLFTLILRKFPEGWRIVHDHTS